MTDSDESARSVPVGGSSTVTVQHVRDLVVLRVAGEIDMTTAPALEDAVRDALAQRPPVLVIDLTDTRFFSSAGIAVLMFAHRNGGATALRVVARDRVVLRPLQLTGLVDDLDIHSTLDGALAA